MQTLFWLVIALGTLGTVAYKRLDLRTSTVAVGAVLVAFTLFGNGGAALTLLLWAAFAALLFLNADGLRRKLVSRRLIGGFRRMLPTISKTEQDALDAGGIWWEGELFTGMPNWNVLNHLPKPKLTDEEQAFLDGPTEELCRMLDDWQVTHELVDLPPEVWEFLKRERFFALIIPKTYGGRGFSPLANSIVLAKIASRNATASSTVGVPNSLGPAELLLHYGTEDQKQRWLPGLANGTEVPCFALTSPRAGSDATGIVDTGVICKGTYEGRELVGVRLNWDKRYITLAPIATVLGLAFKLYDPEHLIGDRDEYGITVALISTNLPGVETGRRHFPINIPFQNGPTRGRDVFVPLDAIIGGPAMAGHGWRMLVQLLTVGRSIVLPSNALGGAQAALYATGAYARIRRQFNMPIGKFHGVGAALARMAGSVYIMKAASRVTCTALTNGEKPAVPSAILKYHNTELARRVSNDGMDVHGGKAIMLGPKNYMARGYQSLPIAITVEGANILTRNLIIFGQGAIRCHPFVRAEMEAARDEDPERGLAEFDRLLFKHVGYALSNAARSLWLGATRARFASAPLEGPTRRYYRLIDRYSASFALATDAAMLTLGGELKRRELLSARLGDALSYLYLASMVLKHYEDQGAPAEDLPLVDWACQTLLHAAQEALDGLLRNLPNRVLAAALRIAIFPFGRTESPPSDALGGQIAELVMHPTATRARLAAGAYTTADPGNPLGQLQRMIELADEIRPLERRLQDALRAGALVADAPPGQIDEAQSKGVLTMDEAERLRTYDRQVMEITGVDDFDPSELARVPGAPGTAPVPAERPENGDESNLQIVVAETELPTSA